MGENQTEINKPEGDSKVPLIICSIVTVLVIIAVILSFILKNPYYIIVGMFLAAGYEVWRTEGFYTKAQSAGILILLVLEILAIVGLFHFDLAKEFGIKELYLGYRNFPLGDIRLIIPVIMALLSLGLLWRTYGAYTKWLSILLVICSFALLYLVNKEVIATLLQNRYI